MKAVVIGLGTQGKKRLKSLKKKNFFICSFDPFNKLADEKKIEALEYYNYDSVFLCVPDDLKKKYIFFFLKKKKNIFLEKPLNLNSKEIREIEKLANLNNVIFYTAYNHRFEPHLIRTKKSLYTNIIGKIYYLKIYYGNGTAKLVNKSWRQKKLNINNDLGSHLVDQLVFLFGIKKYRIIKSIKNNMENETADQSNIILEYDKILVNFEMTYCSWENTFIFYLIGSKGAIKIDNLCKWGPSTFKLQKRKFPSGKPKIISNRLNIKDPTWIRELNYFNILIKNKIKTDLKKDLFIKNFLKKI